MLLSYGSYTLAHKTGKVGKLGVFSTMPDHLKTWLGSSWDVHEKFSTSHFSPRYMTTDSYLVNPSPDLGSLRPNSSPVPRLPASLPYPSFGNGPRTCENGLSRPFEAFLDKSPHLHPLKALERGKAPLVFLYNGERRVTCARDGQSSRTIVARWSDD